MKVSEWLKHEGIAMTAQEQVVTSTPILINHDGKVYAGWKWSDGIENFAHNTAGNAFTLEQDEYSVCGWLHDSNDPHPVPYRSENVGNDSKPQEVTTPSLIEMAEEIERLTQGRIPFERASWIALYIQRVSSGMSHEEAIKLEVEEHERRGEPSPYGANNTTNTGEDGLLPALT